MRSGIVKISFLLRRFVRVLSHLKISDPREFGSRAPEIGAGRSTRKLPRSIASRRIHGAEVSPRMSSESREIGIAGARADVPECLCQRPGACGGPSVVPPTRVPEHPTTGPAYSLLQDLFPFRLTRRRLLLQLLHMACARRHVFPERVHFLLDGLHRRHPCTEVFLVTFQDRHERLQETEFSLQLHPSGLVREETPCAFDPEQFLCSLRIPLRTLGRFHGLVRELRPEVFFLLRQVFFPSCEVFLDSLEGLIRVAHNFLLTVFPFSHRLSKVRPHGLWEETKKKEEQEMGPKVPRKAMRVTILAIQREEHGWELTQTEEGTRDVLETEIDHWSVRNDVLDQGSSSTTRMGIWEMERQKTGGDG